MRTDYHLAVPHSRPALGQPALIALATLLCGIAIGGCRRAEPESETAARPLQLAVTIPPQAWLVERLAGPRADVIVLLPPGESPETWQPDDRSISRLLRADAWIRIGVPAERGPWAQAIEEAGRPRLVASQATVQLRAIEGGACLHHGHDHAHDHGGSGDDPHCWTAPEPLRAQARVVADALAALDPEDAAGYADRLAALESELDALDADLAATLAPARGRAFLVLHPAWGYLADAYGLRQVAIEVAGQAPGDAELTAIRRLARAEQLRCVFVQPQVAGGAADAVAEAIGARVVMLDPLARDVAENLRSVARALAAEE